MGIKKNFLLWFIKFFDKNSRGSGVTNNEIKQNLQLAEELHKQIIKKIKKKKQKFIPDLKIIFGVLI